MGKHAYAQIAACYELLRQHRQGDTFHHRLQLVPGCDALDAAAAVSAQRFQHNGVGEINPCHIGCIAQHDGLWLGQFQLRQ